MSSRDLLIAALAHIIRRLCPVLYLKKKKKNINQEAEQLNAEVFFFFFGQMEPQQVSFNVSFWKVFLEGSYFSGLGWCVQVHVT